MDITTILHEVDSWPVEERIRLVQAVWDRIVESRAEPELTPAQRAELNRRLAALEAAPDDVIPWEVVQEEVRRPR
jgi:putative addiction module component (TIGR02574 family)